ncbi:hypothetical protein OIDMADRAFT_110631 [Oidiodendron maius Zn]|uniref:PARP-type domain-containing protein n=1 Tax=Oidiodendron maius (strain Zn) TaxID=913774 RepID=A0A0C3HIE5_OIDMZ|nr:hypothetical protein OIDMADRAFT_110631 [Oidiodendron maius Zn]
MIVLFPRVSNAALKLTNWLETASSGRAVCRATECKKNGIKIDKDELRMGTWVEFEERGSWQWKHWGCVTGHQLQNIRNNLEDPNSPGTYRWDFLDGYEGDEKNSLDKHPELQEKVRRVITQGFIDPEDFNGDPEMNKLGEKGLYTAESKKKKRQDQISHNREIEELEAQVQALTAERERALENGISTKKVDVKIKTAKDELESAGKNTKATSKKNSQGESGTQTPLKRKRSSNAAKEEEDDDDRYDAKPAKKSRAKKAKKEEGAEAIKEEEEEFSAAISTTKKRSARDKKAIKEENLDEQYNEAGSSEVTPTTTAHKTNSKKVKRESLDEHKGIDKTIENPKGKSNSQPKKSSRKATNRESSGTKFSTLMDDPSNSIESSSAAAAGENYIPGISNAELQHDFDKALDAEEIDDDFEAYIEKRKAETAGSKQKKGRKNKKS